MKQKRRLFYTFIASFAVIIILGAAVNIIVVAFFTQRAYTNMVSREDRLQAERIARLAEEYYHRYSSLEGIGELLSLPPVYGMQRRMGERMMMDPSKMHHFIPPVLIVDRHGKAHADPQGLLQGSSLQAGETPKGVPIEHGGAAVGYVFVGSMITPALGDQENEFLRLVGRSALISSLSVALVAIVLGALLFRSIASPVEALAGASRKIAAGNLGARVDIRRKDELGDLILQFNAMAESIEASREWKRQIISDSAHELRTPVAVIQGELEMILEGVYQPDRGRIESLYRETEIMGRLINELGELAAAEGGKLRIIAERFSLEAAARQAAEAFGTSAEKKGITISVRADGSPEVTADYQKIQQVLRNILGNALKAVPEGGVIDVHVHSGRDEVYVSVDDSGPGIPDEYREKIFERFFRIDPSRSRGSGGAGLGLAISRQIMLLHGGRIWADAGKNGGARISMAFPS